MKNAIMVVDDEEEIRDALSRHFRFLGYEVVPAEKGEVALGILEEKHIDVVISDILMPGIRGIDLLKIIRKEYPMIHVIMITGYVTQEHVMSCIRHGADTCIFKPWPDMNELEASVKKAFSTLNTWKLKLRQLHDMKPTG